MEHMDKIPIFWLVESYGEKYQVGKIDEDSLYLFRCEELPCGDLS